MGKLTDLYTRYDETKAREAEIARERHKTGAESAQAAAKAFLDKQREELAQIDSSVETQVSFNCVFLTSSSKSVQFVIIFGLDGEIHIDRPSQIVTGPGLSYRAISPQQVADEDGLLMMIAEWLRE